MMYLPASFNEPNIDILKLFIREHPLGLLVTGGGTGLLASPIPFFLRESDETSFLITHLARANQHWKDIGLVNECLVVFLGAESYVTPSWYPSKLDTQRVVPTWNYEMIQIRGKPKVIEDNQWLRDQIEQITNLMEEKRELSWKVSDAPNDFIESQLKMIVGIEIEIIEIKGKWKMSQNRPIEDIRGVIEGLSNLDDPHSNVKVAQIVSEKTNKESNL